MRPARAVFATVAVKCCGLSRAIASASMRQKFFADSQVERGVIGATLYRVYDFSVERHDGHYFIVRDNIADVLQFDPITFRVRL